MSRRGFEEETSSAGCLLTGIAGLVLPVGLCLLIAWLFGFFSIEAGAKVLLITGCVIALVFAIVLGFLGETPLDGAMKAAWMSPGLMLANLDDPWYGITGVALFAGALAVFLLRCLPKN